MVLAGLESTLGSKHFAASLEQTINWRVLNSTKGLQWALIQGRAHSFSLNYLFKSQFL